MPASRKHLTRRSARRMTSAAAAGAATWALAAVFLAAPVFAAPQTLRAAATGWSRQPTPNAVVPNGMLLADSCTSRSNCIAVGDSATRKGTAPLAEAWNGTAWRILPTPVPNGASRGVLDSVSCASATACMAVGHDTASSGGQVTLAESWNGTSWTVLPTPDQPKTHNLLHSVSCASATFCIATGDYYNDISPGTALAEQWNGTAWTLQQAPVPSSAVNSVLYGVSCSSVTACAAVGGYLDFSSDDWVTLAATWNGSAWAVKQTPNPDGAIVSTLHGVSCASAGACTAVGDAVNGNGVGNALADPLTESWNGSAWTIQPTPAPQTTDISSLSSVSCTSPHACSAVGYYIPSALHGHQTLAESWNGSTWTMQAPVNPSADSSLSGVSCATAAACVAVGAYRPVSGTSLALAQQWNGSAWSVSTPPSQSGVLPSVLDSVSCAASRACVAVGYYDNSSFTSKTLAETWNGAAWVIRPTPVEARFTHNQLASVSCVSATDCVAVGQSYNGRPNPVPLVEVWNGAAWIRYLVPSPGHGDLRGVSCASATACTAVGYVDSGSSGIEPLAERWNGKAWTLQTVPTPSGGSDADLRSVSCSSPTACTAVGLYDVPGSARTLAERWNGAAWAVQPTPARIVGFLSGVSCSAAAACTAVGEGYQYPQGLSALAEVWQHGKWSVQNTPAVGFSDFSAVSCHAPGSCVAVGAYLSLTGVTTPLAEAWNGATWTRQTVPSNPTHNTALSGVSGRPGTGYTAIGGYNDGQIPLTLAEAMP